MTLQALQTFPYYVRHFFSEVDEHSLQSPFIYKLYRECIHPGGVQITDCEIERLRDKLKHSNRIIDVEDFGAGSRVVKGRGRKISEIARTGISSSKTCRLLHDLVRFFRPENILELGTSLGLSAMCLGYDRQTPVITIEASESLCDLADSHFKQYGYQNIRQVRGQIDEHLPGLLLNEQPAPDFVFVDANHRKEALMRYVDWIIPGLPESAIIVVDDIRWSRGMYQAWNTLCSHMDFGLSLDLRNVGLLIKRPGLKKEHFFLKS